ncbi:dipeptidase [Thalassotalea psychrophila]|uniref:Dipeptidase n=1 Tax=Thalassotalea psychrophila TaxID=3065647 RepID=A0ABY9TY32_9GAMM|nr:dipeptidase [Colwelliaceae bacterium SQ149]
MTNFAFKISALAFSLSSLLACSEPTKNETKMVLDGAQIAQKYIIIDGHIDVPYRLEEQWADVTKATDGGDFDYPRAKSGGLNAPFMSIYIPPAFELSGGSKQVADKLIDSVESIVNSAPEKFAIATSVSDVKKHFQQGLISLPMGMENGSPIEGKIENLKHFYDRGVRYITLTHSKTNHISDSSYDPLRPASGLTNFGKSLVKEMNYIGMMIDVSHISDDAFYQVMSISKAPVIASHSSARKFTPGFERNMSDDMLLKLKENGGVIQINFGSSFISQAAIEHKDAYKLKLNEFMAQNTVTPNSDEVKAFRQEYLVNTPFPFASTDDVLDHFDHVVNLIGIDHVGIGSDYDGVGDSLPTGLKDVSSYPNLIDGLLKRGYSEKDIEKILSGNVFRVWQMVEDFSNNYSN